jgi:hypothetical protein
MNIKSLQLFLILFLGTVQLQAQTATNFTCNDCSGVSHNLFNELDSGKVIVLVWVMPCGACSGPATTAYNTVQGFQSAYPNRVYYYLVDDYANTTCSALSSWANGLGLTQNAWSIRFSNASINMMNYGSTGMPKVVVVGGANHLVYYNANNSINQSTLQNAITSALTSTGLAETSEQSSLTVFPNPVSSTVNLSYSLNRSDLITISLVDLQGKTIAQLLNSNQAAGKNHFSFSTHDIPDGSYLLKVSAGTDEFIRTITVRH